MFPDCIPCLVIWSKVNLIFR